VREMTATGSSEEVGKVVNLTSLKMRMNLERIVKNSLLWQSRRKKMIGFTKGRFEREDTYTPFVNEIRIYKRPQ